MTLAATGKEESLNICWYTLVAEQFDKRHELSMQILVCGGHGAAVSIDSTVPSRGFQKRFSGFSQQVLVPANAMVVRMVVESSVDAADAAHQ